MSEGVDNQIDSVVQGHHKTSHLRVSDGDRLTLLHLLNPQRNYRATRCHNIAVTGATDCGCSTLTEFATLGDSDLLHQRLRDTHSVDWVGSFVGREDNDILHTVLDGREEDIVCADDIGHRRLHREELAGWHLFESRCRENIVDTTHRHIHRLLVAHIADIELDLRVLQCMTHIILLLLVAREDANLLDIGIKESTKHGVSKTSRTARNQQDFVFED